MEGSSPLLALTGVNKSFSGVQVLHDVSFDLFPHEVHCLVGENGAGKSTLIKIISGAYRHDTGEISYLGRRLTHVSPRWAIGHGITTIYQEIDVVPDLSVVENIFLGREPRKRTGSIDWAAMRRQASKLLEDIGVELDLSATVVGLKIAQQQMVAIAKALSLESRVLILDEPTAVFTGAEVDALFRVIRRLKSQGLGLVFISHHLEEIFRIGDRVTVLRDGRVTRTGPVSDFDKNSLVQAMVGRPIDFGDRAPDTAPGEEILKVSGLSRAGVYESISFSLRRKEIVGVAGLVGSGRTEMARGIFGADPITSGTLTVKGKKTRIRSPHHALAHGIGMLPENRKEEGLVQVRPLLENAAYSVVQASSRGGLVPWRRIRKLVKAVVQKVEARYPSLNSEVRYLSGGNQQKVVIARWLAARSDVLILDEPTRGVDVGAREEIYKLMQQFKHEGKAILMISSDLPEILTQSDRILVMAKGRIVGELSAAEATEEKVMSVALGVSKEARS
ncbi:MAG TPA: sugar ABC transporter ATP-binding protein [Spirochaetia bacterium]|nr:sugar ABC transporter ATP-binding protein [Spirochaetia bacterium]